MKKKAFLAGAVLLAGAGAVLLAAVFSRPAAPGFLEGVSPPDRPPASRAAEPSTDPEEDVFTLYDQATGETLEIPGRELMPLALACEMDPAAPPEGLKAQAVASYTLFCRQRLNREAIPCDSARGQGWMPPDRLRERWGGETEEILTRLRAVTDSVYGERITYQGLPILAASCAISPGATESAALLWQQDLPYLSPVASPWDRLADGYLSTVELTAAEFRKRVRAAFPEDPPALGDDPADWVTDPALSPSGTVISLRLGGREISGQRAREIFGLRSAAFTVEAGADGVRFTIRGWGHGAGMSQAGACALANAGWTYPEILAWYYPGAELARDS